MRHSRNQTDRVSTGIASLDAITHGGLPAGEMYVVNGSPGTGKTILALHFLMAGVKADENVLCIALSQRVDSLKETAASVGIDTTDIVFKEFSSISELEMTAQQQTIFDTAEIELEDTMNHLIQLIESTQPQRVVFDGISYLRMLANDPLVYRRQLLILRDYMYNRDITIMLTDTQELAAGDHELVSTVHGVLSLSKVTTGYSSDYRYLQVVKIRGSGFDAGIHDMEISDRGMQVYPLYNRAKVAEEPVNQPVTSGISELDSLLGGSLLTGTSCLLIGPSGTGKTSIATLFASNFINQGGKASVFLFDELATTFLKRSQALGMKVDPDQHGDLIRLHELGLGNITPGKFTYLVERDVVDWGARVVIIDSLTGYTNSMPDTRKLFTQMHELLIALSRRDVLTMLVVAQHGVIGTNLEEGIDISYLADTVLLLRHFEARGALHRAIGVYKKRYGAHETGIREIQLEANRIRIGQPLEQFTGILSGIPNYVGETGKLMNPDE